MPRLRSILLVLFFSLATRAFASDTLVFFGTHVAGPGKGFSVSHFNTDTGLLTPPVFALQSPGPAYFVLSSDGAHLYTCNSLNPAGKVSAYSIDKSGKMTFLNSQPSGGGDPSYISLDQDNRHVLVANYQGGNIAVLAINPDGSLGPRTAFIQHTGHGIDHVRQGKPYAHSIRLDPTNRFALCCDLGLDEVFVYRFDAPTGSLAPNDPPFAAVAPGAGARHLVFGPGARYVYVISEMGSTITQFAWDSTKGVLTPVQAISSLPPDFKGVSTAAEIQVHPNGKFLYASNRGNDTLAVFSINPASGILTPIQFIPSGGKTPRNFAFDPTGNWIILTNHGSNNALVFKVDPGTGRLTQTGNPVPVPYPFCERFLPAD